MTLNFQAQTENESLEDVNLEKRIEMARNAMGMFFNNKFTEAEEHFKKYKNISMYHSVGFACIEALQALLSFEHDDIVKASNELDQCIQVCEQTRKQFKRSSFDIVKGKESSENEFHALLCTAECLLIKSLLTVLEDETLANLISAGLKIRSSYMMYKDCLERLKNLLWTVWKTKLDFESGVKLGIGTFNLMISLLPKSLISILHFIGFSGDKHTGLDNLRQGSAIVGLRQELCCIVIFVYELLIMFYLSDQMRDLSSTEMIVEEQILKYPDTIWFMIYKGKIEFLKGNLEKSIHILQQILKTETSFRQIFCVCYWELVWMYFIKCDWKNAIIFINFLIDKSNWSKALCIYNKSAALIMLNKGTNNENLAEIQKLLKIVPIQSKKISGKQIPIFATRKAEKYFKMNKYLPIPVIELLYIGNDLRCIEY